MNDREVLVEFILQAKPMSHSGAVAIASHFQDKIYEKGDFLLSAGQHSYEYLFLVSGLIRSFASDPDGNEITTNFYVPGETVFEVSSFFNRTVSKESIQALTKCTGLSISFTKLNELFHNSAEFREFGRAVLVRGFSELKARMLITITETAEERYLQLLNNSPSVIRNAPLKMIATYLGITDSSLSRIRKEISFRQ